MLCMQRHKNMNTNMYFTHVFIQTHLTRVCLSAYTYSHYTLITLYFHISRRCFFQCYNNIETSAVMPGEVQCPRISTVTSSPFPSPPAPQTMPHPLGNIMMNTITAAAAESCLRGWFSSWFSRKMTWELLQRGKCEVFQVSVNVGTWVWEPVALRIVWAPRRERHWQKYPERCEEVQRLWHQSNV